MGNENKLPNCGWNFKTCIFPSQKAMKRTFNSLFKPHPPRHDSLPTFLGASVYSFFFSFCLSSLLISLLAMDVYFEMMPYWFMPGKSSRKLTVGEEKAACITGGFDQSKDPLRYGSKRRPVKASSKHSYSDALFLVAPERLRVIRWAPNYGGEDKLVKTCLRNHTSCSSSSNYEDEAVKMSRHNKWASFFPSGSFTCWHTTNYCPQQDPLAQTELTWANQS